MRLLSIIGTLFLLSASSAQTEFEKGVEWYGKRANGSTGIQAQVEPINNAIQHFQKALDQPGNDEEEAVYLLKSYYFKGTYAIDKNAKKQDLFATGKQFGETMMDKYPNSVPIKFWYAANLGRWAEAYGKVAAAREGVADRLRELCKEIIKSDPQYQNGGGYRVLAQVHFQSPYIPFVLSWPSNEKALKYIKKALEISPNDPNNVLQYGKILKYEGYYDKAKQYIQRASNFDPRPEFVIEDRRVVKEAKELMKDYE